MTNLACRKLFPVVVFSIAIGNIGTAAAQTRPDSSAIADSSLVRELEQELASTRRGDAATSGTNMRAGAPTTNPDISVIGDFRVDYVSEGDRNVDAALHEAELALKSAVDPYARGDVYVAMGHDDGEFEFELEEAYLTTLSLPYQLQVKAGKFRSNFGKINRIHPHALPFIGVPAMYANFFGEEGLNDQGLSVSWLVPNRRFYQELTVEVTRGPGENESFATDDGNRLLYLGHLRNFWDLTDDATIELGLSGAVGPNDEGKSTMLGGVDLTYKWKPVQFNTYRSFALQGEVILAKKSFSNESEVKSFGMYLFANYQLARRWFAVGRIDHSDVPDDDSWNENGLSLTLGWYATEFQKLEFGIRTVSVPDEDRMYGLSVRSIFVIGTHGAHEY